MSEVDAVRWMLDIAILGLVAWQVVGMWTGMLSRKEFWMLLFVADILVLILFTIRLVFHDITVGDRVWDGIVLVWFVLRARRDYRKWRDTDDDDDDDGKKHRHEVVNKIFKRPVITSPRPQES